MEAVLRILDSAQESVEQSEIVKRLPRALGRKLDQASYAPYTSKALGHLLDEGRVEKAGDQPAEWGIR